MHNRSLLAEIVYNLERNAAVALLGPRQIGKTTLAFEIAKTRPSLYLDLESPEDLIKLNDPVAYLASHQNRLVILDEIQRSPDLFMVLRGIIDAGRRQGRANGQFLILGSASHALLQQSSESLAGRITYLELCGLSPFEVGASTREDLHKLWFRGGFPASFDAADISDSNRWRKDMIRTYLERDIPQLGPRIPAATLHRFWTMLAHTQGELFNASKLAESLDVKSVTTARYLDLMIDLLLVRKLRPWFGNTKKRLVKSSRTYIRDSGLLHQLLNIANYESLLSHPILGKSWEGFVIENILSVLPDNVQPFFYRSSGGAEIDLLLEVAFEEFWAIEIKHSTNPKIKKGFHFACEDLNIARKYVVYSGEETFPMGNDLLAISLATMMLEVQNI